jgi:hypothetical protein
MSLHNFFQQNLPEIFRRGSRAQIKSPTTNVINEFKLVEGLVEMNQPDPQTTSASENVDTHPNRTPIR